ncbi:MAG: XdhC family protein [Gammaproteobacteria bacterium]|nr:XdhC family protein [Gammaproteobacteria bacterium]
MRETDALYVGAMGQQMTAAQCEHLPKLGLNRTEIEQLHAQIGFQIGSKIPAQIAIAFMPKVRIAKHR